MCSAHEAVALRPQWVYNGCVKLIINTDGGARPTNPGPAACSAIIQDVNGGRKWELTRFLGETTNNQAEYEGVLLALNWLEHFESLCDVFKIEFLSDSALVVNQIAGIWAAKDPQIRPKAFEAAHRMDLLRRMGRLVSIRHVPRAENSAADALCTECILCHA